MSAPYRHITCCVDRSEASRTALAEAVRLRELGPGRLTLLHVADWGIMVGAYPGMAMLDPEVVVRDSKEWLDQLVAETPGAEGVLLEGYPAAVACEWAAANDTDLLVASSSRGLVDRWLLGSFAGYLTRHAPCTMLLTRPPAAPPSD